ncbi:MAG: helix-turn-helix domain-containing protein [Sphaerochaetaceae bacterium]|jgi:two-component system response regulator YesN|nr:helix-turn-helix domain-containing protein [Sphaerochaetaceae bacterium]
MAYTVVIVEDEQIMLREILQTINWKALGLSVIGTAEDGPSALALIENTSPDIVITDIGLPGIDGLSVLEKCNVPYAVILSGHSDFTYAKRAIKVGVFDYILKPVDDDELEATLKKIVNKLDDDNVEYERLRLGRPENGKILTLPLSVDNHQIQAAILFIEANYSKQIGLTQTADELHISESHLSRLFKEVTGLNFLQYLNALRINKSIEMMANPNKNITEIALACGFATPGYYAKLFRRFMGATPSQFRDLL